MIEGARLAVGIDLGTTNTALAYREIGAAGGPVEVMEIPQLVQPGEVMGRTLLPSFLYLPHPAELPAGVGGAPATYAPDCLSTCELAFHCRERARAAGAVTRLGRPLRAELGGLTTVEDVLAAARGELGDPDDPAVAALRRAAALRAEALQEARAREVAAVCR